MKQVISLVLIFALLCMTACREIRFPSEGLPPAMQPGKSDAAEHITEPPLPETVDETSQADEVLEPAELPQGVDSNITDHDCAGLIAELKELSDNYRDISIYYTDVEQKYYLAINADYAHEGASTLKALYCHFLLKNNVDRERIIKFEEATRTSTSGELTEDDVGRKFSVDELIRLAIVYSDNMAYRLLFRTYGRYGFNEYIKSLGIETPQLPPGYEFSTVTAHDLSVGMLDIYNYSLETDYQWYIDLLIESAPGGLIDSGTKYAAAHKYGYHGGYDGYHDTAIIYAPTPYVITIMTRVFPYSKNSGEVFEKVTQLVEEIHEKLN